MKICHPKIQILRKVLTQAILLKINYFQNQRRKESDDPTRIRHTTTLKLNDQFIKISKSIIDQFENDVLQIQRRSISDLSLSDIDFKIKMARVWTALKILF